LLTGGLLCLGAAGCSEVSAAPEGLEAGEQLYIYCVQCHDDNGSGNQQFRAPALAGMPSWYVVAQLDKFRSGARGDHPDDVDGLRMRPMSRTLKSQDEVEAVANFIETLTPTRPERTMKGDAIAGAQLYKACVQCHGAAGEGVKSQAGPPLIRSSDWYMAAQIQKFKDGIRGTDPEDKTGAQMRPMAMSLPTDKAVNDVIAYIMTMR
jgi:cytochrome c553